MTILDTKQPWWSVFVGDSSKDNHANKSLLIVVYQNMATQKWSRKVDSMEIQEQPTS